MNKGYLNLIVAMTLLAVAPAQGALAKDTGKPGAPKTEVLQKATAISLGNMAWESVIVSDVQTDAKSVKWIAKTPTGNWRCTAATNGGNPYCDK